MLTGSPNAAGDGRRPGDLPEGALLGVLLAAAAGVVLVVPALGAALVIALRRSVGVRTRWLAVLLPIAAFPVIVRGVEPAVHDFLRGALLWRIAPQVHELGFLAWLASVLPLALPVAVLLALAGEAWMELHHPFWDRRRAEPVSVLDRLRLRRARRRARHRPSDAAVTGAGIEVGWDDRGRATRLTRGELAQHALVVGATGAGKTTTLLRIAEALVAQRQGFVVIDLKGDPDIVRRIRQIAARADRGVVVWSLDGGAVWNPLAHGGASELTDKLIALEQWSEPHYQRAAQRYLHTVLAALVDTGRVPTLGEVSRLLDVGALRAFVAQQLDPERAARVNTYLHALDKSTMSAIIGLANRVALLTETRAGIYLDPPPARDTEPGDDDESEANRDEQSPPLPEVDLDAALGGGDVVVFSLDSQRWGETAAQVASLAILDLKTLAGERLARGVSSGAFVVVDEFSAIGADHVASLLARARSAGIGVLLSTQELADLSRVDEGFADQVLGNTNVKLIHRQDVPESAERLASVAGTTQGFQETLQTERTPVRMLGGKSIGGHVGAQTGVGTIRSVEHFRVHPNDLKTLTQGAAVLVVKHPALRVEHVQIAPPAASQVGGAS